MLKRLLSVALAFVLVLGITGGVSAQERPTNPIEMVGVDYGYAIYGSGVITSPNQELWFVGSPGAHTCYGGIYDPSGNLDYELFEVNFEDIEGDKWGSYVEGACRYTEFWANYERYYVKVTYKADRPFQATPFHAFLSDNGPPRFPELPEVPTAQYPTDIYFRDIYVELAEGGTTQLTPTILPANANQSVEWSSSNTAIASVNASGVVTANSVGMAFITARTVNGLTAQCVINVVEGAVVPEPETYTVTVSQDWYYNGGSDVELDPPISFEVVAGEPFECTILNPGADEIYSFDVTSGVVVHSTGWSPAITLSIAAVTQNVDIDIEWIVWGP